MAVLCCDRGVLGLCWGGPGSAKIWGVGSLRCAGMCIESADMSTLISMQPIAGCLNWMECAYDSPRVLVSGVGFDQGDKVRVSGRMDFGMGAWGVKTQRACPTRLMSVVAKGNTRTARPSTN